MKKGVVMKRKTWLITAVVLISALVLYNCSSMEYTSAKTYVQQNDLEKAEEFFLKAIDLEPENPEIPLRLARDVYIAQDRYKDAKIYLEKSLKVSDVHKEEIMQLKEFLFGKAFNKGRDLYNSLIGETDEAKVLENSAKALELFILASEFKPDDPTTYSIQTTLLLRFQKDTTAALAALDKGLVHGEGNVTLLTQKALILEDLGYIDEAEAVHQKAYASDPIAHARPMADFLLKKGKNDEAIAIYQSALEKDPTNEDLYFNLGLAYQGLEMWEKALEMFQNVMASSPDNMIVIQQIGDLYMQVKDYGSAEFYYRMLTEKEPTNAIFIKKLGRAIYFQPGRMEEGQALFESAKYYE
jgi:tetratricopeptide (TPR) repeat protein